MKYIVDIPEEMVKDGKLRIWGETEPECKWFDTGRTATPYEEPSDTAEDAWKIAQDILKDPGKDGMLNTELNDCFGTDDIYLIGAMSYTEVKAKYDAWKKQKDEIKVGDEVVGFDGIVFVVVGMFEEQQYTGIVDSGMTVIRSIVRKTGRHFPEVAELLKKMREKE